MAGSTWPEQVGGPAGWNRAGNSSIMWHRNTPHLEARVPMSEPARLIKKYPNRRRADVLFGYSHAVHPLLRKRDAGDARYLSRAQHAVVRRNTKEHEGAVAETLRRARQGQRGPVEAVHGLPGPGNAESDLGVHGPEPQRVPPDAGAAAKPDARHIFRLHLPGIPRHAGIRCATGRHAAAAGRQ